MMIKNLTQTVASFVLLLNLTVINAWADTSSSAELVFSQGWSCVKSQDLACAKVAQSKLNSQSKLAKILDGAIALAEGDADLCLRILLPLKADANLIPQADTSLHASLALAYEMLDDPLRAIEHHLLSTQKLSNVEEIASAQQALWKLLSGLDKAKLVELRGAIDETTADATQMQGWIDLALTVLAGQSVQEWRANYRDHPASELLLGQITANQNAHTPPQNKSGLGGKIALLLPFNVATFYPVADAIERGFSAAKALAQDDAEVKIYPSNGSKEEVTKLYAQAIKEGARFVLGPLTRDEATALIDGASDGLPVTTLMLNQPELDLGAKNMHILSLSVEAEAAQIAKIGRDQHYQSALIITSDNAVAMRMSKVFYEAWQAEGGTVVGKVNIKKDSKPEDLQVLLNHHASSDLIVLACDNETARAVRPFISITTPTYGFSHLYSGLNFDEQDQVLNAIHFIDMPWMLMPQADDFMPYQKIASELPQGQIQRWFALGADAYQVLKALATHTQTPVLIHGLTGKISISEQAQITREFALGIFGNQGVMLEKAP